MSPAHDIPDDDESDAYSVSSGSIARFAPSTTSSATSYDWEMRSASPAPSVYSMTSSLRAAAIRQEFGRSLNNYSEVYQLPADEEELDRLDKQHIMFIEVMGKYPPPLPQVLQDDTPGEVKACVDLGCGSGSWILDVARDFPHCSTVAVDLVPMQVLDMPPNCRSEVDDINLGLEHFYGDFNVVHARLISSGVSVSLQAPSSAPAPLAGSGKIRDYASLIDHCALTIRSGGLLDLTEFDFHIYGIDHRPILAKPYDAQAPWLPRWMNLVGEVVKQRGGTPEAATHMHRWIQQHGAFEDIVYRQFWFQTSPWRAGNDRETYRSNRSGACMRDDILSFLGSARPLLLGSGVPEPLVNELEMNTRRELLEARTPHYVLVENVYARKRRQQ